MSNIFEKQHNQNYVYIYYLTKSVNEGGMARNKAFYEVFKELNAYMFNLCTNSIIIRLWFTLKAVFILFFFRNKIIFIHQGTLLFIFSMFLMRISLFRKIIFSFLNKVSNKNKLIIEINDLIYEQSIDLELEVDEVFKILQQEIFTIKNCNFIFASYEMESYVKEKYNINAENSNVIINGAPQLINYSDIFNDIEWMSSNKRKFVYAGSLNRGRQIEQLLQIFKEKDDNLLILVGSDGEWINDTFLNNNIIYMGNYQEDYAHYLVSRCDIGIIPYDADRLYYNMCYPTKASFYITAGLPVLSTPLKELQKLFNNKGVFLFSDFKDWGRVIESIDNNVILKMKNEVDSIREKFYWKSLFNKVEF